MVNLFENYIAANKMCTPNDRILIAVSGGIDSMAMLNLFLNTKYRIGVAHCNFNLRGEESDSDEKFVRDYTEKNNLPFYTVSFATKNYAAEKGISIQMAARDLRYTWLYKTADENGYDFIAVGHNSDDSVETFFINLTRNSGIHGLTGIKPKNNRTIRPLLFASRKDIETYVQKYNIKYREDSSNAETKYLRNKLRNSIIPEIEKINPSFRENIHEVIERMRAAEKVLFEVTEKYRQIAVTEAGERTLIDFRKLPLADTAHTILFELIKEFGFNSSQVRTIAQSVEGEPGRQFFSGTHRLIKDRNQLIIIPIKEVQNKEFTIEKGILKINIPVKLNIKLFKNSVDFVIPHKQNIASFDSDKLVFPLKLRKWRKGDRFMPFGMIHFKKLSDFFTDKKLSIADKELIWIIESAGEIAWIVNYRVDNRFRIDESTKNIIVIEANI